MKHPAARIFPAIACFVVVSFGGSASSETDPFDPDYRPAIGGVYGRIPERGSLEDLVNRSSGGGGGNHCQPDNWIGERKSRQRGDDVYNHNGGRQEITLNFSSRQPKRFYFRAENDGRNRDDFTILGPRKDRKYRLSYLSLTSPPLNVTGSVTTGRYQVGALSPGDYRDFRVRVKPSRGARRGTLRGVYITSTSEAEPHAKDCVRANCRKNR